MNDKTFTENPSPAAASTDAVSVPLSPAYRSFQKIMVIALAVVGGIVLLFSGFAWLQSGPLFATGYSNQDLVAEVDGVTELNLEVGGARLEIVFADVNQAELAVAKDSRQTWYLQRNGARLDLGSRGNGRLIGAPGYGEVGVSTLYLPEALGQGNTELWLSLGGGSVDVQGDFSVVDIEVGAGKLDFAGHAAEVTLQVGAGQIDAEIWDAEVADLQVAAGKATVDFEGDAPKYLGVDVAMGNATLQVPDVPYQVASAHAMGNVELAIQQTQTDTGHVIDANVGMGTILVTS